jgi:hypothetical protein
LFRKLARPHGALLAGLLGDRIYHLGATLPSFMLEILVLVIFLMCVPFSKETILQLAVVTVAPVAPLLLTMMPLEELVKKPLGILFK